MKAAFIKMAAIYFLVAIGVGIYMGIAHDFAVASVHGHLNLLGWVTTALFGVIYHLYPKAGESKLAKVHFWFHSIGAPIFIIGVLISIKTAVPVLAIIGSNIVGISVILFVINVFVNVKAENSIVK